MARSLARRIGRGSLLLGALLVIALPDRVDAQRIALRLRPRVGDTISMRLDQTTSVGGEEGARAAMSTTLRVRSRAIVEGSSPRGSVITSVTDSLTVTGTDPHAASAGEATRRALVGQRVRALVTPEGLVELLDRRNDSQRAAADLSALVPAALPESPVAVGETWERRLILPSGVGGVGADSLELRATFRLDSLGGKGRRFAYVSVHGDLAPPPDGRRPAAAFTMSGTMIGGLVLDRVRGWLSDSRVTLTMRAVGGAMPVAAAPMRLVVRVTQRLRTLDTRDPRN